MAFGYLLHTNQLTNDYEHSPQRACFFTDGRWWLISYANPSAEWYLFKWTGSYPENPATVGGWDYAQTASGNVLIDTRLGARPDAFWDEATQTLHVLVIHTTEYYDQWTYNSGTGLWSQAVNNENVGITMSGGNPERVSLAVDSNGVIWVVYFDSSDSFKLKTRYRSGGSWSDGPVLESTGSVDRQGVDVIAWSDEGTPSIGAAYTYDDGTNPAVWKFAYRPDSASLSASWTYETIEEHSIDNHISIAAGTVGGGDGSTLVVVGKDGDDVLLVWRRPPGSAWDARVQITGGGTGYTGSRPKVVIDETNQEVYVVYGNTTSGVANIFASVYQCMPVADIQVATQVTVLEADSPSVGDFSEPTVPAHAVNGTTGLLIAAFGPEVEEEAGTGAWWNILPITAPPGGGLLPKMMQYGLFTGDRGDI
jgi:hypothetical protein